MKIGIYTLPFYDNLGGITQAFALQKTIEKLGYEVFILKHRTLDPPQKMRTKKRIRIYFKRFLRKYLKHEDIDVLVDMNDRKRFRKKILAGERFINTYMHVRDFDARKETDRTAYDVFVVGSDQVWRPIYAVPIENYFLNFIQTNTAIRKIVYAASFGTEKWEYTDKQAKECAELVQNFDLITVREDSGVKLCKEHFNVKAEHVLDPTLLLDKTEYIDIIEQEHIPECGGGNLFVYMLDDNEQKQEYVRQAAQKMNLRPFSILPTDKELNGKHPYPDVPRWLRAFMDAEFVITDSFHGCVFSIIFNKPFMAIGNKERGQARFDSLFRMFQLHDRLTDVNNLSTEHLTDPINWTKINAIREKMKLMSISLLSNALK